MGGGRPSVHLSELRQAVVRHQHNAAPNPESRPDREARWAAALAAMNDGLEPVPAAQRTEDGRAAAIPAALGRGLVHSKQSSRDPALRLSLDPEACMLRRARRCGARTKTAARLLDECVRLGGFTGAWLFITLTYRNGADWRPDHVRKLMNRIRSHFERRGVRCHFVWTGELQKRGAIHYHLLLWRPKGVRVPFLDRAGWWPHGMTQVVEAQNPVAYMAKYASKLHGGLCDASGRLLRFPKGARICGAGGLGAARGRCRYWMAPRYVRDRIRVDHGEGERDVLREPGGWRDAASGVFYASEWRFIGFEAGGGGLLFQRKESES